MNYTTRFAPSPTGPLHLGHAYSALLSFNRAKKKEGAFLLRIEDIDQSRARAGWEATIYEDLNWLGVSWVNPILRQSNNLKNYTKAISQLWNLGLLYKCDCSRRDITEAVQAPQEGYPLQGPDGVIYPGTCRNKHPRQGSVPPIANLRLDLKKALDWIDDPLYYEETGQAFGTVTIGNTQSINTIGDIVIARRDMGTSYHLSVVVDDAAQNITEVIRGEDLADATRIHVILQALLNLKTPVYHHHHLIRDATGKRLAKRDDARSIATYRVKGATPADIKVLIGL